MKALALFSGGLDSMLACKIISQQGIEVIAVHIRTGFGGTDTNYALMEKRAKMAGADFKILDVNESYYEMLLAPKYGYGKAFNPCIDCHGFMFKYALDNLEQFNASFIITGEVIGQRPMSQRKDALNSVKKLSGEKSELVLRPLCAKNLSPTLPEINGWVDREKLLDISGRGRKRQIELAKKYGFSDYESPAGGCLLTMEHFGKKLKEHIAKNGLKKSDVELLKHGRHLRLENGAKMIIGRDENENEVLKSAINEDFSPIILPCVGAFSLLEKKAGKEDIKLACKIALTYSKAKNNQNYEVLFLGQSFESFAFENKKEIEKYLIK